MIDTPTIARRLEAAKMPREQAEAVATALRESELVVLAELATKADLEHVRLELKADIEAVRKELKGEIEALRKELSAEMRLLEQRMTIKLGSMLVIAVGVTAALVKLL
ncbi:MAG: DUF1640 domain-containing protein [Myxococcales bacterium]|nr:DUF1640 domain-containing protein [Myxococcales bacterium]